MSKNARKTGKYKPNYIPVKALKGDWKRIRGGILREQGLHLDSTLGRLLLDLCELRNLRSERRAANLEAG